jgi:ArsR family transcriptional regulator
VDPVIVSELSLVHDRFCRSLADPKRLLIMSALAEGERCVSDLAQELELRQANVSQHLALLRDRGIVRPRRQGSRIYYSLTSPKFLRALALLQEILREEMASGQLPASLLAPAVGAAPGTRREGAALTAHSN